MHNRVPGSIKKLHSENVSACISSNCRPDAKDSILANAVVWTKRLALKRLINFLSLSLLLSSGSHLGPRAALLRLGVAGQLALGRRRGGPGPAHPRLGRRSGTTTALLLVLGLCRHRRHVALGTRAAALAA